MKVLEADGYLSREGEIVNTNNDEWCLKLVVPIFQGKEKPPIWVNVICLDSKCEFINFPESERFEKSTKVRFKGNLVQEHFTRKDGSEGTSLTVFANELEVISTEREVSKDAKSKPVRKNSKTKQANK